MDHMRYELCESGARVSNRDFTLTLSRNDNGMKDRKTARQSNSYRMAFDALTSDYKKYKLHKSGACDSNRDFTLVWT